MTTRPIRTHVALTLGAGLTAGALLVATVTSIGGPMTGGQPATDTIVTMVDPIDPEVVLPSRVDAALRRMLAALGRASAAVDDRQLTAAIVALTATRLGLVRSRLAGVRQVEATPPPDSESESTAGPDSVLAILNVDQVAITQLAGLFDRQSGRRLSAALKATLNAGLARRADLLTTVLALDPEEAGAPYADALVDTVPNYTDEVDNLKEALRDDHLTSESRATLEAALTKSKAAEAAMIAAFGGAD